MIIQDTTSINLNSEQPRRYWAMRSARNTPAQRDFLFQEALNGRLRQGWSYHRCQNLHSISERWDGVSWTKPEDPEVTTLQNEAWPNFPMLGRAAPSSVKNRMNWGDIVLVPNMPANGRLSIFRISGDYTWDESKDPRAVEHFDGIEFDFASTLIVTTIRADISKYDINISSALAASLKTPMRLWSLDGYRDSIDKVIMSENNTSRESREIFSQVERADLAISSLIEGPEGLLRQMISKLQVEVKNEGWEHVLKAALVKLLEDPDVVHTGGVKEQGRDLEITYTNPFLPYPLIVAIQVKDWIGIAGVQVCTQLQEIVDRYRCKDVNQRKPGYLTAIVLAVTNAEASPELQIACTQISEREKIPVMFVGKDELMKMVLRGLIRRW